MYSVRKTAIEKEKLADLRKNMVEQDINEDTEGVVEFTDGISTISIGKSTLEDVENAFGEPKYITHEDDLENTEYKNEKATTFMYEPDEGKWLLYITFDENDVSKYFTYRGEY